MTGPAAVTPSAVPPGRGAGDVIRAWWERLPLAARWLTGLAVVAVLAGAAMYPPPIINTPNQSFSLVLAECAMVALIGIGLNVVVGQAGLLDLGYVGFFAVGAYTVGLLTSPASPWNVIADSGPFSPEWAWLSCLPIAVVITAFAGLILGTPTLRLRGDYLAIVTLGFGEIVRLLADNLREVTRGGQGLPGAAYPRAGVTESQPNGVFSSANNAGHLTYGVWWFWLGMALVLAVLALVRNLERSRVGRAWVAIREDEDVAEIMGVPTFKFKLWAFIIGAAIGGLSGALYAGRIQFISPGGFNVISSMLFLCAVVLGGQGNKLGVVVGAFIVVYLPYRLTAVHVGEQSLGDYKYLFFGLALIALMIFRPQGLFPAKQKLLAYGDQVRRALRRSAAAEAQS